MRAPDVEQSIRTTTRGFGPGLQALRLALDLTQAMVARSSGLSKNSITGVEAGVDSRLTTVVALLVVYGLTLRTLRQGLGLTEADMARKAGLGTSVLLMIEEGFCVDLVALLQLANAFRTLGGGNLRAR